MKQKRLIKKIRRLEARLQKGSTKLASLKRKLRADKAAKLANAKSKSSARARKALTVDEDGESIQAVEQAIMATAAPKPKGTRPGGSFKKARTAAKKAAAIPPE